MASALPPPPLVCTIQTVESRWSGQPIPGIRQLEQQQFRIDRGGKPSIEPATVIESRLTPLVERFSSSGVEQSELSGMTYHWSYEAPLGPLQFNSGGVATRPASESRVAVSGDLIIDPKNGFKLSQQSRLTQSGGTQTLSSLLEKAHGSCREQR
nr:MULTISPECIES: hypothetical protein [unclassified Synechococcus]